MGALPWDKPWQGPVIEETASFRPARPPAETDALFPDVLAAIYAEKYTGPLILHCQNGVPVLIERPNPTRIRLRRT